MMNKADTDQAEGEETGAGGRKPPHRRRERRTTVVVEVDDQTAGVWRQHLQRSRGQGVGRVGQRVAQNVPQVGELFEGLDPAPAGGTGADVLFEVSRLLHRHLPSQVLGEVGLLFAEGSGSAVHHELKPVLGVGDRLLRSCGGNTEDFTELGVTETLDRGEPQRGPLITGQPPKRGDEGTVGFRSLHDAVGCQLQCRGEQMTAIGLIDRFGPDRVGKGLPGDVSCGRLVGQHHICQSPRDVKVALEIGKEFDHFPHSLARVDGEFDLQVAGNVGCMR